MLDVSNHLLGGRGVGAAEDVRLDLLRRHLVHVHRAAEVLHGFHAGEDFHAPAFAKEFAGDGPGGDAADGLAGAGASAAGPSADAILGLVSVVGVRGAELLGHLRVGLGALVRVLDHQGNGRAESLALEGAGEDLDGVGFLARRGDAGLAGAAAVEVGLDVRLSEGEARRAAVHDDAHARAVRLAPSGDAEELAEGVAHSWRMREGRADGKAAAGAMSSPARNPDPNPALR